MTTDFTWTSIIGGYNEWATGTPILDSPVKLDDVELVPAPYPVSELTPGPVDSLAYGGTVSSFWPLIISGTLRDYAWPGAADRAAAAITELLCAYLSTATPIIWRTRQAPQPIELQALLREWHGPRTLAPDLVLPETVAPDPFVLPSWFSPGWERVKANRALADAVLMFHEGCLLTSAHPSFALVAFTSVVESVAQHAEPPERCTSCKTIVGSTRRFTQAVASVMGDEVATLLAPAYDRRSRSVHSSLLHGEEVHRGSYPLPNHFGRDAATDFRWVTLRYTKDAARALVQTQLRQVKPPANDSEQPAN